VLLAPRGEKKIEANHRRKSRITDRTVRGDPSITDSSARCARRSPKVSAALAMRT
jgi:hypothetical protein